MLLPLQAEQRQQQQRYSNHIQSKNHPVVSQLTVLIFLNNKYNNTSILHNSLRLQDAGSTPHCILQTLSHICLLSNASMRLYFVKNHFVVFFLTPRCREPATLHPEDRITNNNNNNNNNFGMYFNSKIKKLTFRNNNSFFSVFFLTPECREPATLHPEDSFNNNDNNNNNFGMCFNVKIQQ